MKNNLNMQQRRFCYEYVKSLNGKQAAIAAGYSAKTAEVKASQLLTIVKVQNEIARLRSNIEEASKISALSVVMELKKIAFASISDIFADWSRKKNFDELPEEVKACIKSIKTKTVRRNEGTRSNPEMVDVEYVHIELHDKQKALDIISKMLGFNAPQRYEVGGANGLPLFPEIDYSQLTDEELKYLHSIVNKTKR